MIAIIAAIAELLFFSAITAMVAMVAIIWKPGFREPEKLHNYPHFADTLKPGFYMIATIAVIAAITQWKVFSI